MLSRRCIRLPNLFLQTSERKRVNEQTRTADLISLRVGDPTCQPVLAFPLIWLIYADLAIMQHTEADCVQLRSEPVAVFLLWLLRSKRGCRISERCPGALRRMFMGHTIYGGEGKIILGLLTLQSSYRANSIQDGESGLPRIPLPRLSEKSRTPLQHSLTGQRKGTFRPILAFVYRPNLRPKRCSYPFSDSLSRNCLINRIR